MINTQELEELGFHPMEGEVNQVSLMRTIDFDGSFITNISITRLGFGSVKNSKRGRFGCRKHKYFRSKVCLT